MADREAPKSLGPVTLGAGSYDADKLRSGLDAAASAKSDEQMDQVAAAIVDARVGEGPTNDPALMPDHVMVELENGFGGKERRQVYAPALEEQHRPAEQPVMPSDPEAESDRIRAANQKAIAAATKSPEKTRPVEDERTASLADQSHTGAADPAAAEADTTSAPIVGEAEQAPARAPRGR